MQAHAIAAPRRGRIVGLFLALLLQAGFVWALVTGLTAEDLKKLIPPPIIGVIVPRTVTPPVAQPQVPERAPEKVFVPEPGFKITDDRRTDGGLAAVDDRPHPPGAVDAGPLGLAATHTIPPYPPLEQRLGHEGTVVLRLTISAQGNVTEAVVLRSSGFERLDEAARAWVMAHWRYRPAMRGGVPVPSAGNVSVTFNLKNAG
jgi:protein TonB